MNKNKGRYLPLLLSLLWLTASGVGLTVLYALTRYLPLLLGGLIMVMVALIYWVTVAFFNGAQSPETPETTAVEADGEESKRYLRALAWIKRAVCRVGRALVRLYFKSRTMTATALAVVIMAAAHVVFWLMLKRATTLYTMNYLIPVILVVMFVVFIIFEKWCAHAKIDKDARLAAHLKNVRSAMVVAKWVLVPVAAAMVIKLLGLWEALSWLNIILAVLFGYVTVLVVLSFAVKLIRREMADEPDISIPMPFSGGGQRDLGIMGYLEKNTGITMRSLWSIQFIKKMVPYVIIISVFLLWVCSGIVQIESYQAGAVYRLGKLQDKALEPGLHLTLPWPFDRVQVYDTETVNSTTIGYISSDSGDNTWTGTHGSQEYRLLLGGGNELVSINLRLEYRIDDVISYLRTCSNPEKLLEAKAYELVTDLTIVTDLDELLSVDRSAFANSFREELASELEKYDTGLELVGVVLESIHPPVDIADVYQSIIGAEIKAEQYILEAQAAAAVKIADAEKQYDTALNLARADSYTKTAAAKADVAEFMASVSADKQYPDTYRYYKYLKAIGSAYGSSRLIIVGKDIDSSNIYLGGLPVTMIQ